VCPYRRFCAYCTRYLCESHRTSGKMWGVAGNRGSGQGVSQEGSPAASGGPELFRLVRFWSRRWASQAAGHAAEQARVQHVQVVEAVNTQARGPDEQVSVVAVAHQLGVDRSVASRMITESASAGYVRRDTSAADARRVGVRLTDSGRDLLAASHRWQQQTFDDLVAGWDPADRRRLAQYLHRLAVEVVEEPHSGSTA
jgi:DNA-binding MarR family transcriptional regulator